MSKYISLENLERYDAKMQERAASFCASKEDGMWRQTEKAGAVSFWPVGSSPLEGTVEFMFKETSPASGNKSPTNPSAISGVSEIKVTRANSNLIRWPYFDSSGRENNGITWTVNGDGSISATGTSSAGSSFRMQPTDNYLTYGVKLPAGTYRLSGCPAGGAWNSTWAVRSAVYSADAGKVTLGQDFGNGATVTVTEPSYLAFFCYIWSGNTVSNLTFAPKLQLVEAPFEKNEQDVYTIPLGGTFYGGSVDLATGVMSVEWESIALTGSEQPSYSAIHDNVLEVQYTNLNVLKGHGSLDPNLQNCTHIPFRLRYGHDSEHFYISASNGKIFLWREVSSLENYLSWLTSQYNAGHPVTFVYKYENPFTVQLTPPQILALAQPDKYVPRLNTVYTDADAVQIVYQKNPVRDKFEKVQAIIAQGGNV